jgi:ubiquitin C-terminal hydrolase
MKGLRNYGNTCYINAVLQCLMNMCLFRDNKPYEKENVIVKTFRELEDYMKNGIGDVAHPLHFIRIITGIWPNPFVQKDACEFFLTMINSMGRFVRWNVSLNFSNYLQINNLQQIFHAFSPLVKNSYIRWYENHGFLNSFILDDMTHQTVGEFTCRCGHNHQHTFQHGILLALAIPAGADSLEQCLDNYFHDHPDDKKCDSCNTPLFHKLYMTRLPKFLVIALQRYDPNLVHPKISAVPYKGDIDMGKYVAKDFFFQTSSTYTLKNLICHDGDTPSSGHFYAVCNRDQKLYKCDDIIASVHNISLNDFKNAYMMFYERND